MNKCIGLCACVCFCVCSHLFFFCFEIINLSQLFGRVIWWLVANSDSAINSSVQSSLFSLPPLYLSLSVHESNFECASEILLCIWHYGWLLFQHNAIQTQHITPWQTEHYGTHCCIVVESAVRFICYRNRDTTLCVCMCVYASWRITQHWEREWEREICITLPKLNVCIST